LTAAVVVELTPLVETAKGALAWPAGTVTEPGTVAAWAPLERLTMTPPAPAGPDSTTVPVDGLPPVTLVGFKLSETSVAAVIVRFADWDTPFNEPVIAAVVVEFTGLVDTENLALDFPAAMLTEPGAVAAALPLARVRFTPLGPAKPVRETVPVDELPPCTEVGDRLSEASCAG
jgi:hypothetical protein